jgi:hypothetical protein
MANWLFKEIPVYKVYLGWIALLLFLVIVGSIFNPSPYHISKARAKIFKTRSDEKFFVFMLKNQLADIDLLASNELVLSSIPVQYNFGFATNQTGAMIDIWQTPYKIEIVQQTNFIIHSAGPNHKFGDADDIIFNSVSNDFVKP